MAGNFMFEAGQGAPGQESASSPIDMDHLDQQSLGDPGLRDEVLRLYAQMSQVYLGRIEASASPAELQQHIHTLKSAAAGIGAWQVRDLAKHAEDTLREGNPVNAEHIRAISAAVADCREFIDTIVSDDTD